MNDEPCEPHLPPIGLEDEQTLIGELVELDFSGSNTKAVFDLPPTARLCAGKYIITHITQPSDNR